MITGSALGPEVILQPGQGEVSIVVASEALVTHSRGRGCLRVASRRLSLGLHWNWLGWRGFRCQGIRGRR